MPAALHLTNARTILEQAYPITQDTKLLLAACGHIAAAGEELAAQGALSDEQMLSLLQVKAILAEYDDAAIAFRRRGAYVIADNDYNLTILTEDAVRGLLATLQH